MLDHSKLPWGGLGLYTLWRWRLFSHFPVGPVKKFCFGNWFAHGDQTAAEDPSKKCVVRRCRKVGHGGRFTFRKTEHQARHSHFAHWLAGPLAWSEIDPAHRAFDARAPTKPNFQRPERSGQRCKWRLVCEWVCTVTSVSVRIEKRANCAKNNKPKSGGLFLVNARPFPEQSLSIATYRVGSILRGKGLVRG